MSSRPTSNGVNLDTAVIFSLDPFSNAVTAEEKTRHIAGDDDGEHLMGALAAACAAASPTTPVAPLSFSSKRTLANVPYQFLHVEVSDKGQVKSQALGQFNTSLGEHGALAKYFPFILLDGTAKDSLWGLESNPDSYSEDYPFSIDNFDCERLVGDLEDDNDLLDRDVTTWALWAAMSKPASSSSPDAFEYRQRIFLVDHLFQFLDKVRGSLNSSIPIPTVYFIVAVSYMGRFRNSDVTADLGGMMMAAPLHSTLTFFTNMVNKKQAQASQAPSSVGDDDEEDDDEEYDDAAVSVASSNEAYRAIGWSPAWSYSMDSSEGGGVIFTGNPTPFHTRRDSNGELVFLGYHDIPESFNATTGAYVRNPVYGHCDVDDQTTPYNQATTCAPSPPTSSSSAPSERIPTPPPPSILQTLDTNAAKGDAVEGDLHALLPEAQSPEQAAWEQCCRLLCIDPEAHKDAQARSVKIPGTDNMWVKPSQLWTAYWMLTSRTDRGLCGGVLADAMGTGKTYVCLVVCLLRAYIGYNRAEVEREWQLREHEAKKGAGSSSSSGGGGGGNVAPKQHLPRNVAGGESVACPCGNAMGIECFANPGGITRQIADTLSRGASLILAPQTVLDNWVKTVKHVRLQHKFYEPVVFHSKMSNEDVAMQPAPRLKQKLQMGVRPQARVSKDGLFAQTWQPNVHDVIHDYQPSIAKDAYPERFIFLATHTPEKLTEFFQLPVPLRRKAGAGTRERKTVYGCPIGIQMVDEFHKAKDDVVALALQHKHLQSSGGDGERDNFDFWAITGTPMPAKLTDLEPVADILQRLPQWHDAANPHHGSRVVALRELQVVYEKAVAEDGTAEQAADFRSRAERFFQGGIIKRHTESSMFFGQRIFDLQDVTAKVVVHTTPAPLRNDVSKVVARVGAKIREHMANSPSSDANWEQAVRSSSLFNHMMDLEILATFPGAAPLMLADPPVIDFGLAAIRAEIRKAENHDVNKVELFQAHLDTIIKDSPHLQAILETLKEMEGDRTKRRVLPTPVAAGAANRSVLSKKKADLSVKKLVVLCPRMGEAVFVFLALCKLRPDFNPVFLHADLKLSERTALLQDFNRLDAPTPAGINHTARILVGTFRDAGTGNDLTVANYQILTGPLRLRSQQDQAFGRTNREGQTLRLHHRLLVTEDSPVDRIVMVTQARRHIVSDPFNMDEELELVDIEKEEQ